MEIDWFWLAVICGIAGLTITICVSNYFDYKTKKEGIKYMNKKEEEKSYDGA